MKILKTIVFAIFLDAPAAFAGEAVHGINGPACPMTQSLVERYGISFSGFKTALPITQAPDTKGSGAFVRVAIPGESNVSDGFHHTVIMDTKAKKAWILRTGGFVSVYQWFGPIDVINDSLKDCRLEPNRPVTTP